MKLFSICTPSHRVLRDDWFLPSLKDNFDLRLVDAQQHCSTASFYEAGWTRTTLEKVDLICDAIAANMDNVFVYSDVDVQFFRPAVEACIAMLDKNDIALQRDDPKGTYCTGFFICRASESTLDAWRRAREIMSNDDGISDQRAFNLVLASNRVVASHLPNSFFGGGTFTGRRWSAGEPLEIPQDIIMHHANYTVGTANKLAQLSYVKSVVNNY